MPVLTALHLRKAYGPQQLLADVSFTIKRGEKVAIIGANGSGKSTLGLILAGLEPTDEGEVQVRRGAQIAYLSQNPVFDAEKSALELVEEGLSAWHSAIKEHDSLAKAISLCTDSTLQDKLMVDQLAMEERIAHLGGWNRAHQAQEMLQRLGVSELFRPFGTRSGGEQRRIALARLLVSMPDLAILDEPTNHLDARTTEWLEGYLANDFKGAILLITHDRYFLESITTRMLELERAQLTSYDGRYSDYLEKKSERMAYEDRVEQNRQNILRREREWLSRGPKARTTKQKARIDRAHQLEAQTAANAGRPGQVQLHGQSVRMGKTVLELKQVSLQIGARLLTKPFDLIVNAGDRIGIIGNNGVGKTTLIRAIMQQDAKNHGLEVESELPFSGVIELGKNTKIAYLDQSRTQLDLQKTIAEEVQGDGGETVRVGELTMELRSYLELFLFDKGKQRQKVAALSGGERARVALAKLLRNGSNLLIFDEPTNDLDLPTLASLEQLLIQFGGACLVVTHDRAFLDHVATATLAFETETSPIAEVERHAGGYEDYVSHKREWEAAHREAVQVESKKPEPVKTVSKKKGLSYAEQKELDGLWERIEAAESLVQKFEQELADPQLYVTRSHESKALLEKLESAKQSCADLMSRLEVLEQKKAES